MRNTADVTGGKPIAVWCIPLTLYPQRGSRYVIFRQNTHMVPKDMALRKTFYTKYGLLWTIDPPRLRTGAMVTLNCFYIMQVINFPLESLYLCVTFKYHSSYKNNVLWDFKEMLLMHQILSHYLCGIELIKYFLSWATERARHSRRAFFLYSF
jgi:hypothetical protein